MSEVPPTGLLFEQQRGTPQMVVTASIGSPSSPSSSALSAVADGEGGRQFGRPSDRPGLLTGLLT
jgi:hypothetical protein